MVWQLSLGKRQGAAAEQSALDYLLDQGLTLVAQNYACRLGELDLIMLHRQTLVFIEVRSRSPSRFGGVAGSIDYRKQQKMRRVAQLFLQQHREHRHRFCRFDVVTFTLDDQKNPTNRQWIKQAF